MSRLLLDSSDDTWKYYGKNDPYYGVLSHPEYRLSSLNPQAKQRFFRTGQETVDALFALMAANSWDVPRGRALDFGCGVGRIVLPLSRMFTNVIGIDVSPDMLTEAQANCRESGIQNASFLTDLEAIDNLDFAHSVLVFQHIPKHKGLKLIFDLWSKLNPNGILAVQLPTFFDGSSAMLSLFKLRQIFPLLQIPLNLVRGDKWNRPGMQMNIYNLNEISAHLLQGGATTIFLSESRSDDTGFFGSYIIARKSGTA
jgi:SAM-dependent methyltransferase